MESIPKVAVDGAQLLYRRIGAGRPLLVLHGFAATSADLGSVFHCSTCIVERTYPGQHGVSTRILALTPAI